MKKNLILSVLTPLGVASAMLLSSCAPNTPQSRIEKNPGTFSQLSNSDKELARQGQIKKGMHKDAVFIAMGKPDGVSQGNRNGAEFEKWIYTRSTPVFRHGIYPRIGYGIGGWGRGRYNRGGYYGVGFNPGMSYVRRTAATVDFNRYNKVTSWESRK